MIYPEKPDNFNTRYEAVGCFCRCKEKFLMLKRQDNKPEGNKWGLPSGKIEPCDKSPLAAALREAWEETGLLLFNLQPFSKVYVRYPDYDFTYHMFSAELEKPENVIVMPTEHKSFYWARPHTALKMNLVRDLDACIRLFYAL